MVELLLEHCANVGNMDSHGNTCMHWAAMAGHADVIKCVSVCDVFVYAR